MTRFQRSMAAWACLGMLLGPVNQSGAIEPASAGQAAATPPPAAEHLDLTYVPAMAVAAVVAHPQAVLTRPEAEMMPVEVITAAGLQEAGFDPVKIKEAVVLLAPPNQNPYPEFGAILRFSEAYSKSNILAKLKGAKQIELDGKSFVQVPGPNPPLLYFADAQTIIDASPAMMKAMLAAKGVDSPLVGLLKTVDVSADLTVLFSVDATHDMLKGAVAQIPPLPPQLEGVRKLPDLLSAVMLRVNIGAQLSARLVFRAHDDASAQDVENLVNQGLALARQMVMSQLASLPRGEGDPVQEAGMKYTKRISDRMFGMVKPARNGQNVTISVEAGSSIATIGVLVALLLPAVQSARSAARRMQSANNLKQISIALLQYEQTNRKLPAHAIFGKDGKPLLSWRVAILPYLDQQALYEQFHLDEPWDSEHNKPLSATMLAVYSNPSRPIDGKTTYLVPVGKGLGFEGAKQMTVADITDGMSNTIAVVEANEDRAVPWAKPDDLEVDLNKPLDGLGDAQPGGFSVALFDGSVHFIAKTVDPVTLRALFTRAGNEVVDVP